MDQSRQHPTKLTYGVFPFKAEWYDERGRYNDEIIRCIFGFRPGTFKFATFEREKDNEEVIYKIRPFKSIE